MDIGDEGTVDLDFVGGDIGKHRGGIAGAEVIDGYAHAEFAQHGQDLRLELARGDECVLRDFDDEPFREAALCKGVQQSAHEIHIACLLCGDIDGNGLVGPVRLVKHANGWILWLRSTRSA